MRTGGNCFVTSQKLASQPSWSPPRTPAVITVAASTPRHAPRRSGPAPIRPRMARAWPGEPARRWCARTAGARLIVACVARGGDEPVVMSPRRWSRIHVGRGPLTVRLEARHDAPMLGPPSVAEGIAQRTPWPSGVWEWAAHIRGSGNSSASAAVRPALPVLLSRRLSRIPCLTPNRTAA